MFIAVDVGGTKTRVASSRDLSNFDQPVIEQTEQNYERAVNTIVEKAKTFAGSSPIEALSIGIPATLSRDKRMITGGALHIPEWKGKSIVADLETRLGTRVVADNDVAIVGLGEAHFGAGKDVEILVYMTVSTGVNAVRIVNGTVDVSAFGFSTGHQYLAIDPPTTIEQMISGGAVEKKFGVAPKSLGKEHPVWEELARTLAFGVHNTIMHWSPDRIVLGGSMFNDIGISVDRVKVHLAEITSTAGKSVEIVHAELGDLGGLWGGLALLKSLK